MSETKQSCSALLAETLKELSEAKAVLVAEDYYDLVCAVERCILPDRAPHRFLVPPVIVGPLILELPSIAAVHWWETFGWKWCGDDSTLTAVAKAYLCANGRDEKKIAVLWGAASCEKALMSFRLSLGASCTSTELAEAVSILFDTPRVKKDDKDDDEKFAMPWRVSGADYGDAIALLCSMGHLKPSDVLYIPINQAREMMASMRDPQTGKPLITDQSYDAFVEFRKVVDSIKEKRCSASA